MKNKLFLALIAVSIMKPIFPRTGYAKYYRNPQQEKDIRAENTPRYVENRRPVRPTKASQNQHATAGGKSAYDRIKSKYNEVGGVSGVLEGATDRVTAAKTQISTHVASTQAAAAAAQAAAARARQDAINLFHSL